MRTHLLQCYEVECLNPFPITSDKVVRCMQRKENVGEFKCKLNSHCASFNNSLFICVRMFSDVYFS